MSSRLTHANVCFQKLAKGDDNWSLGEVVHAIVLLAHFHSLSSFVFSCGINEELDHVTGHHYNNTQEIKIQAVPPPKIPNSPKNIPNSNSKTVGTYHTMLRISLS